MFFLFFFSKGSKVKSSVRGFSRGTKPSVTGVTPWPKLDVEHDVLAGFVWRKKTKSGSDSFSAGLVVTRTIEKEPEMRK